VIAQSGSFEGPQPRALSGARFCPRCGDGVAVARRERLTSCQTGLDSKQALGPEAVLVFGTMQSRSSNGACAVSLMLTFAVCQPSIR
jgi:hypothetical protein